MKIGLLRSLRKAAYSPDAIGHYGLAKSDYAHFTSPIRRYADLLVHRSFTAMLPREEGTLFDPWISCRRVNISRRRNALRRTRSGKPFA